MDDERALRDCFLRLLELDHESAQRAELDRLAAENPELAQRVEKLLRASRVDDSFLETPAARSLDAVLGTQTGGRKRLEANLHELFERMGIIGQSLGSFGSYELKRVVKVGGSSIVFEAFDAHVRRRVAIKCWWPSLLADERERERVLGEARSLARVDDPHVIQVLTVVERGEVLGVLFPWVEGPTLDRWLENHPQRLSCETFSIAAGIVHAIEAVHRAGIVHRDIKPQNIVIDVARGRPILVDFELAWDLQDDSALLPLAGTPLYMAPEAIRGARPSRASDLFALGCVLYEMFAGKPPFMARAVDRVFQQILNENPIPLTELAPQISPRLASMIESLLAKNPSERPSSLESLSTLLEEAGQPKFSTSTSASHTNVESGPSSKLESQSPAGAKWTRRATLATIATALVGGTGYMILKRPQEPVDELSATPYVPLPVSVPLRRSDETLYVTETDTSALRPTLKNIVEVHETDSQVNIYWAPTHPNVWGEIHLRPHLLRSGMVECAMLGLPMVVYNVLDTSAEARFYARVAGESWYLLADFRPRVNGLQTFGQEINVTSLVRHPGIEILVRLKASKKLKPPVPQDVECYAASQLLRRSKRDTVAVMRVWYRSSDA